MIAPAARSPNQELPTNGELFRSRSLPSVSLMLRRHVLLDSARLLLVGVLTATLMARATTGAAVAGSPSSGARSSTETRAKLAEPRQVRPIGPGVRGWRLNAKNVGLARFGLTCDDLPRYRGPAKPSFGARIVGKLVTVPLDLSNGGVKVRRSCIRPTYPGGLSDFLVSTTTCGDTCYPPDRGRTVITDSEISGYGMEAEQVAGSCGFMGVGTIRRTLFRGMGNGICIMDTGTRKSVLVEQNYVTNLRAFGDSHNEAATVRDFRGRDTDREVVFRNNRLSIDLDGNTSGGLFIQPTWKSIYHLDVVGNLLEGIGYNLVVTNSLPGEDAEYGDLIAVNNRFLSEGYGPASVEGPGWDIWRENYHYAPGRPGSRGRPVREP